MKTHNNRCVLLAGILSCSFLFGCDARYDDGVIAANNGDYAKAIQELKPLAEESYTKAQSGIGQVLSDNRIKGSKELDGLYRMAAEKGEGIAQFNLGQMYIQGQGVEINYKESAKWFRLAAAQGVAIAQYQLAMMYYLGRGVQESNVIAFALYQISAAGNSSKENPANAMTASLVKSISDSDLRAAKMLALEMEKPGNFLNALDRFDQQ